jgi:hypothetical protein
MCFGPVQERYSLPSTVRMPNIGVPAQAPGAKAGRQGGCGLSQLSCAPESSAVAIPPIWSHLCQRRSSGTVLRQAQRSQVRCHHALASRGRLQLSVNREQDATLRNSCVALLIILQDACCSLYGLGLLTKQRPHMHHWPSFVTRQKALHQDMHLSAAKWQFGRPATALATSLHTLRHVPKLC